MTPNNFSTKMKRVHLKCWEKDVDKWLGSPTFITTYAYAMLLDNVFGSRKVL